MKDYNGRELKVGDYVSIVHPHYRNLVKGRIVKFCDVQMKVEYSAAYGGLHSTMREPSYVAYLGESNDTSL